MVTGRTTPAHTVLTPEVSGQQPLPSLGCLEGSPGAGLPSGSALSLSPTPTEQKAWLGEGWGEVDHSDQGFVNPVTTPGEVPAGYGAEALGTLRPPHPSS